MANPAPPASAPHLWARARATATIAVGQTASDEIPLIGLLPYAIRCPAGLTATILYLEERDEPSGTWSRLTRDGSDITIQAVAGKTVVLDPQDVLGITRLRIVAGTAQATADAVLTVLCGAY